MNAFITDTVERTIRAAAAAALGAIGTAKLVTDMDWGQVGSITAMAAGVTVLTCLASGKWGAQGSTPAGFVALAPPTKEEPPAEGV